MTPEESKKKGSKFEVKGQGHSLGTKINLKIFLRISWSKGIDRRSIHMYSNTFHQFVTYRYVCLSLCLCVTYLSFIQYWNVVEFSGKGISYP